MVGCCSAAVNRSQTCCIRLGPLLGPFSGCGARPSGCSAETNSPVSHGAAGLPHSLLKRVFDTSCLPRSRSFGVETLTGAKLVFVPCLHLCETSISDYIFQCSGGEMCSS